MHTNQVSKCTIYQTSSMNSVLLYIVPRIVLLSIVLGTVLQYIYSTENSTTINSTAIYSIQNSTFIRGEVVVSFGALAMAALCVGWFVVGITCGTGTVLVVSARHAALLAPSESTSRRTLQRQRMTGFSKAYHVWETRMTGQGAASLKF